jgi:hypothetical protein
MSAVTTFPLPHDPEDRADYTFQFSLAPGESIASASVTVVDRDSGLPVSGTDLTLASVAFGPMPDGITQGVTVWVSHGGATAVYYLDCEIQTNSQPIPRILNRTVRLLCRAN